MEKRVALMPINGQIPEIDLMAQKINDTREAVLRNAIAQYLGRPFDILLDKDRINLVSVVGSNDLHLFIDEKEVGVISYGFGYNGDDFERNRFTVYHSFTPNNGN